MEHCMGYPAGSDKNRHKNRHKNGNHLVNRSKKPSKTGAEGPGDGLLAPLCVLLAGALWGSMGLFVRRLADVGCSSVEIAQLRCIVTTLILGVYLLAFDRARLRIRIRDLWCFLGTGILSIVFFNVCYFTSIEWNSLSVAAVLLYTGPAFVIALSAPLFHEKITGKKVLALALTMAGCFCVSGLLRGGAAMTPRSFLIGLGSGLGYALYSIFSRYALERGYGSMTISFYTFLFAALGTVPFVSLPHVGRALAAGPGQTGFIVLFGIVTTVIPYLAYTRGLSGMENGRAAILSSVEPVVATLIGILVFREAVHADEAAGIFLVLAAILLSNCGSRDPVL